MRRLLRYQLVEPHLVPLENNHPSFPSLPFLLLSRIWHVNSSWVRPTSSGIHVVFTTEPHVAVETRVPQRIEGGSSGWILDGRRTCLCCASERCDGRQERTARSPREAAAGGRIWSGKEQVSEQIVREEAMPLAPRKSRKSERPCDFTNETGWS